MNNTSSTTLDKPTNIGFLWTTMTKEERELLLACFKWVNGNNVYRLSHGIPQVDTLVELPFVQLKHAKMVVNSAPEHLFEDKGLRSELTAMDNDRYNHWPDSIALEKRLFTERRKAREHMLKLFEPNKFWTLKGIDPS